MIFIRLAGLFFAFVQITLALRLILPFVEVPEALADLVPPLIRLTDIWLVPVHAVAERLDLFGLSEVLAEATGTTPGESPEQFEPAVLVAMLLWAGITMFVLFVLRLIFRPVG